MSTEKHSQKLTDSEVSPNIPMSGKRVLIIGLDGATFDLIKPWVGKGKLPHLADIMRNGVSGRLRSIHPPFTIPAWNCMTTGKNPGRLGVFHFMKMDGYSFHPYFLLNYDEGGQHLWDILNYFGKRVCVVNVPNVHYAYEVNGHMVAGWLYYSRAPFTYPYGLKQKLDEIANGYRANVVDTDREKWLNRKEALRMLYETTEKFSTATKYLMSKHSWDFFMVVFSGTDWVQHHFWTSREIVLEFYEQIDKIIGELVNIAGDDALTIIVSDHGFGPIEGIFHLNNWLVSEGLMHLSNPHKSSLSELLYFLWTIGLKTGALYLGRKLPDLLYYPILKLLKYPHTAIQETDIDWARTKAYGVPGGGIRINLKGREPMGVVEPGEYEYLRSRIVHKLEEIASLRNVNVCVFKREDLYNGEQVDQLPDIVIAVEKYGYHTDVSLASRHMTDFSKLIGEGEHRLDGIFMAKGEGVIKKNENINNATILDIVPTALYGMGLQIPRDVDGKVLTDIFTSSFLESNPISHTDLQLEVKPSGHVFSKEEEEEIKDKLRALGYLG